jgi:hypothetical protein
MKHLLTLIISFFTLNTFAQVEIGVEKRKGIEPEVLFRLVNSLYKKAELTLTSLNYHYQNTNNNGDGVVQIQFQNKTKEKLILILNIEDSIVQALNYLSDAESIDYIKFLKETNHAFKEEILGDKIVYLNSDETLETYIMDDIAISGTKISISTVPIFENLKEYYISTNPNRVEKNKWQLFKQLLSQRNKNNKTVTEALAKEIRILDKYSTDSLLVFNSSKKFEKINGILQKEFTNDRNFMKSIRNGLDNIFRDSTTSKIDLRAIEIQNSLYTYLYTYDLKANTYAIAYFITQEQANKKKITKKK